MRDIIASMNECVTLQNALPNALKTAVDLKRYEAVIDNVQPGVIVECGTAMGGSALWFADTAHCPIITIDICPILSWNMLLSWDGRVRHLIAPSDLPELVAQVDGLIEGLSPVMVVLDSDHSTKHVAAELEAYAHMVTPGSYMVVEDTLVRYMSWFNIDGNPWDAVDDFLLKHGDEWENDEVIDDMFPTGQHHGGWLRRRA